MLCVLLCEIYWGTRAVITDPVLGDQHELNSYKFSSTLLIDYAGASSHALQSSISDPKCYHAALQRLF